MNLILNRNFELPEDGWYQLAPLGEFPHAAAGITQVIDEAACARMVTAFENARAAAGNFPGLLIDFDHFSLDATKHSEAAGWITDLKFVSPGEAGSKLVTDNRQLTTGSPSGLLARIRWSDTG
jgi:phage I-like protein